MPTVPSRVQDYLDWAEQRADAWQSAPTAIGLNAQQATAMVTAVQLARAKYVARNKALTAAENALTEQANAIRDSRRLTSDLIRAIRGFAANSDDPAAVLTRAELPEPATPTPLAPPGRPTNLTVGINPTTGAITIGWKAVNPQGSGGTGYIVRRKVGTSSSFDFVGVTGTKEFTDSTFIAGPDSVQYTVQGQRAGVLGPLSDILTINFGRVGPGQERGEQDYSVQGGEKEQPPAEETAKDEKKKTKAA